MPGELERLTQKIRQPTPYLTGLVNEGGTSELWKGAFFSLREDALRLIEMAEAGKEYIFATNTLIKAFETIFEAKIGSPNAPMLSQGRKQLAQARDELSVATKAAIRAYGSSLSASQQGEDRDQGQQDAVNQRRRERKSERTAKSLTLGIDSDSGE